MKNIYLDHSATTPVDKMVVDAMLPYFSNVYGNPSSIHNFGQLSMVGVDKAREQVAKFLNCQPGEIIFTSGATESDNLAIKGVIKALQKKGIKNMHVITTLIEHDAVLEPFMEMEKEGIKVTYLPVKSNGVVDVDKFKEAVNNNTILVSVMYVNSEIGSVQPIREIAKIVKKMNEKRDREWEKKRPTERGERPQKIYFHTDATQAANYFNCDVEWNYIDLLSMSGHKIYGPKGVGLLYKRNGVPLESLQKGGHHEKNLRSGTLNVPGIVGLGAAIDLLGKEQVKKNNKKITYLRDMLADGIIKNIPNVVLNTDRKYSTPSHAHFSFLGAEGESVLISLDLEGIAVSTGSACASSNLQSSHVLKAMGVRVEDSHSSIRFSLGKYNTEAEIKKVLKILPSVIKRLRKMNPIYK